jgi:hypothetical protein
MNSYDPPVYDEEDEWDPPMEPAQIEEQFPEYFDPAEDDE